MPQLLFVDACVRGAESRSRMLAERFLSSYAAANPDAAILRRDLMRDRLEPQYPEVLARRDAGVGERPEREVGRQQRPGEGLQGRCHGYSVLTLMDPMLSMATSSSAEAL